MKDTLITEAVYYHNLFAHLNFQDTNPSIETIGNIENTNFKRVSLKAGTELKCHKTDQSVSVVWLRGKAKFLVNQEEYTMHPGSFLNMPSGTPHGAKAETNCVFIVIKIT